MNSKLSKYYGDILFFGLPIAAFLVAIAFYLKTYDSCQIKITLLHMCGSIVVVAWFMKLLEDRRNIFTPSSMQVVLPVMVFLVSGIVSHIFFSPFKSTSFEELLRRILYIGTFLVIFYEYRDFVKVKRLIVWMILAGVIAVMYGFVQHFKWDPFIWKGAFGERIFSTFGTSSTGQHCAPTSST